MSHTCALTRLYTFSFPTHIWEEAYFEGKPKNERKPILMNKKSKVMVSQPGGRVGLRTYEDASGERRKLSHKPGAPRGKHCIIIVRPRLACTWRHYHIKFTICAHRPQKTQFWLCNWTFILQSYTVLVCVRVSSAYTHSGHHSGSLDHSLFRLDMCLKNTSTNETKIKGSLARCHASNSDKTVRELPSRTATPV